MPCGSRRYGRLIVFQLFSDTTSCLRKCNRFIYGRGCTRHWAWGSAVGLYGVWFAQRLLLEFSRPDVWPVSGGSAVAAHDFSCLPHILQVAVVSNVAAMTDLLQLRLCSKTVCELLEAEYVLQGCVVDLREARARAFRSGSTLLRRMHALLRAHTLKVQYRHVQAVPLDSPVGVEVYWAGQTYVRRDINFRSWCAIHPVCQHASMEIAASSNTRVLVLGIKNLIRNSPPMSRMWVESALQVCS